MRDWLYRPKIKRDHLSPNGWPTSLNLRIVALSDIHACRPWMGVSRIRHICETANALEPDIILLLGDYMTGLRYLAGQVPVDDWADALATLDAPLGVHAVLGNHDWWEDSEAQLRGAAPTMAGEALSNRGVRVYENDALELNKQGQPFWIAGLADQHALMPKKGDAHSRTVGLDDIAGTLALVSNDAPVILMAHEPDIFPEVPRRVSLTLSGHTHGGQVRIFGYAPVVPSRYGNRYAYGHVHEDGRDLIVSGGLGYSILPIRFGAPSEINLIELGDAE